MQYPSPFFPPASLRSIILAICPTNLLITYLGQQWKLVVVVQQVRPKRTLWFSLRPTGGKIKDVNEAEFFPRPERGCWNRGRMKPRKRPQAEKTAQFRVNDNHLLHFAFRVNKWLNWVSLGPFREHFCFIGGAGGAAHKTIYLLSPLILHCCSQSIPAALGRGWGHSRGFALDMTPGHHRERQPHLPIVGKLKPCLTKNN